METRLRYRFLALLKLSITMALGCCFWLGNISSAIALPLAGSIDFHVHTAPDVTARKYTDIELAQRASTAGMAAVVLKNHVTPTADRAVLAHQLVPDVEVYGGVVLNNTIGGLNLQAIVAMERLGAGRGKVVWLPTIDAAYHRQVFQQGPGGLHIAQNDRLVPEMKAILDYIAEHNLVLGTGHISPAEVLCVVRAARATGVKKILVTHAMATVPGLNLAQMEAIAQQGALLELTYVNSLMGANAVEADHKAWDEVTIETMAAAIQTIGAEHFVLSTDLGRALDLSPIEGYQAFLDRLGQAGIPEADLRLMAHSNPQKLLQ